MQLPHQDTLASVCGSGGRWGLQAHVWMFSFNLRRRVPINGTFVQSMWIFHPLFLSSLVPCAIYTLPLVSHLRPMLCTLAFIRLAQALRVCLRAR